MSAIFYSFLLVIQLAFIQTLDPREYGKCDVRDSECLTRQVQLRVPEITSDLIAEIAARRLDPLIIDVAEIDIAGVKINFYKAVLRGIKNIVIESMDLDSTRRQMRMVAHTDAVVKGRYTVDGNVLGFVINEDGDAEINSKNFQIGYVMPYDIVKDSNGKAVFDLKSFTFSYDIKDSVQYNFTNLFRENKGLSDSMHHFLNRNTGWSKVLITTYGKPLLDMIAGKMFNAFRSYLLEHPIDEMVY
ncbi:protein takeout-like [Pieris brassicae]|uniref:Uncharacterized protein n=1 Tax=Pieris brassicae TaxID=7116 RepID=A0A9P0XK26_PIEBR|nr:protein takeout-like [Pieris brassicae]CAH4038045.1 unnamed protein product [Pieris brassicae]